MMDRALILERSYHNNEGLLVVGRLLDPSLKLYGFKLKDNAPGGKEQWFGQDNIFSDPVLSFIIDRPFLMK